MSPFIPTTEQQDQILDAWALGIKGDDIAKDMNLRKSIVFRTVQIARKQGDPRAKPREHASKAASVNQTDYWDKTAMIQRNEKFLELLAQESNKAVAKKVRA